MVQTHSFRPEALRGKRLAQGHPASGDREIPALTRASKAQHPLGGWGGGASPSPVPGISTTGLTPNQEPL